MIDTSCTDLDHCEIIVKGFDFKSRTLSALLSKRKQKQQKGVVYTLPVDKNLTFCEEISLPADKKHYFFEETGLPVDKKHHFSEETGLPDGRKHHFSEQMPLTVDRKGAKRLTSIMNCTIKQQLLFKTLQKKGFPLRKPFFTTLIL